MASALEILGEKKTEPTALSILGEASKRKKRTGPGIGAEIGGALGGLAGGGAGPISIGGAALGGSAGEAIQQSLENGLPLLGPGAGLGLGALDPSLVGRAGAEQGGYQLAGGVVGKGIKAGGKLGVNIALKFTPEIAQTAIKEGITATGMGVRKLLKRIGEVGDAERKIVAAAAGNGVGWRDPVAMGRAAFDEVAKSLEGAPSKEISKLSRLKEMWEIDNPDPLNPLNLLKKRQYYDAEAAKVHEAIGKKLKVGKDVVDRWNLAMANQARKALQEDIPAIIDPGAYQKLGVGTSIPSDLQKLRGVLVSVVNRGGGFTGRVAHRAALPAAGATIGGAGALLTGNDPKKAAFEGAVAGAALDPAVASTIGLHAQNPLIAPALSQLFRMVGGLANQ